jgi:uncharacterized protein (TIGR03790 family)
LLGLLLLAACAAPGRAELFPGQLLIVTNNSSGESAAIGEYYMLKRGVPAGNLLRIDTTPAEHVGRQEYEDEIASPIRRFLAANDPAGDRFRCIVLVYGIPLRIDPPTLDPQDSAALKELKERGAELRERIKAAEAQGPQVAGKRSPQATALHEELSGLQEKIQTMSKQLWGAAVDSEIALVLETSYGLEGWLPNPDFIGYRLEGVAVKRRRVLLVSRLDGPDAATVFRLIDDSMEAEQNGLSGKAYFDARFRERPDSNLSAYRVMDYAIHNAARVVEKSHALPVVLDEQERLFQPGEAPDAALYCGWYSLEKYVDAFTWAKGAVGYHVASGEMFTLKDEKSHGWCKEMLKRGVAATLGPVAEPFVQSFPRPDVFFDLLLQGLPLAECYAASNPVVSWQLVLIGDPLYRPFRTRHPDRR